VDRLASPLDLTLEVLAVGEVGRNVDFLRELDIGQDFLEVGEESRSPAVIHVRLSALASKVSEQVCLRALIVDPEDLSTGKNDILEESADGPDRGQSVVQVNHVVVSPLSVNVRTHRLVIVGSLLAEMGSTLKKLIDGDQVDGIHQVLHVSKQGVVRGLETQRCLQHTFLPHVHVERRTAPLKPGTPLWLEPHRLLQLLRSEGKTRHFMPTPVGHELSGSHPLRGWKIRTRKFKQQLKAGSQV